ncbi:MAG: hypothetical protein ACRYG7_37445 [Janthinobacterium lividum]
MFANRKILSGLPLLPLALLLACKKDETNPDTTGIRLFTNKTEITDVAVKTKFLSRASADFRQTLPVSTTDQVKFSAPDTATFGSLGLKYVAAKSNDQYLFTSPGGLLLSSNTMLLHDMLKYTAPIYPFPMASGIGYATSEVRVGYDRGSQIQLSRLQYYWLRGQSRYYGVLFNELNEGVVAKVTASDTLAVRQSSLTTVLVR